MKYPEKVERRPDRILDVKHPEKVERWPGRIPDVRHPGGMSAEQNSGCDTSGWNGGALPYPDSLREKHSALAIITPRTIAYPIRICCPDHWLKCQALLQPTFRHPSMVCPDALSLAMDSKELSSISDCFGDQKAIKTPKLNTI